MLSMPLEAASDLPVMFGFREIPRMKFPRQAQFEAAMQGDGEIIMCSLMAKLL